MWTTSQVRKSFSKKLCDVSQMHVMTCTAELTRGSWLPKLCMPPNLSSGSIGNAVQRHAHLVTHTKKH